MDSRMSLGGRARRLLAVAAAGALTLSGVGLVAGVGAGAAYAAPADAVEIADPKLKTCIEWNLGSGVAITEASLAGIEWFSCEDAASLDGLEHMVNAKSIEVGYKGEVSSLAPLSDLTGLERLEVRGGSITDLTPLEGLSSLTRLNLSGHSLRNLTPLSHLTGLTDLSLLNNEITSLDGLKALVNLENLAVSSNLLASSSDPVQGSQLEALKGMTKLRTFDARRSNIDSLEALSGLTQLEDIYLTGNSIDDVTPLAGLTEGGKLYLDSNYIVDMSPVPAARSDAIFGAGQTAVVSASVGEAIANPVTGFQGELVSPDQTFTPAPGTISAYDSYDPASGQFLFEAAGTYTSGWGANSWGAFDGMITWQVAEAPVTPEDPTVVQARRNADGSTTAASVTPAVTEGISYTADPVAAQPGQTVRVTASPDAGKQLIDPLPQGWVLSAHNPAAAVYEVALEVPPLHKVAPQAPTVAQATREPDGSIIQPQVQLAAAPVGIDYEMTIERPLPAPGHAPSDGVPLAGDTIIVTASLKPGFEFDLEHAAGGWALNTAANTMAYTVELDVPELNRVVPVNPTVVQAERDDTGAIIPASVTPVETVGLDYSLSPVAPVAGDTVTVTATPIDGFEIDAANLFEGWVINDKARAAGVVAIFVVQLDELGEDPGVETDPEGKPDAKPSEDAQKPGLADTGTSQAAGLALGGALIVVAGVLLARRRRVDA